LDLLKSFNLFQFYQLKKAPVYSKMKFRFKVFVRLIGYLSSYIFVLLQESCTQKPAKVVQSAAQYIGSNACKICHAVVNTDWERSYHCMAMLMPNDRNNPKYQWLF
jgi:hypothetical protein